MSNMDNIGDQLCEKERQQRVYDTGIQQLSRRRLHRERGGLVIMYALGAFGDRSQDPTRFGRLSRYAAMFRIGFAFLAPCLLFARYLL